MLREERHSKPNIILIVIALKSISMLNVDINKPPAVDKIRTAVACCTASQIEPTSSAASLGHAYVFSCVV